MTSRIVAYGALVQSLPMLFAVAVGYLSRRWWHLLIGIPLAVLAVGLLPALVRAGFDGEFGMRAMGVLIGWSREPALTLALALPVILWSIVLFFLFNRARQQNGSAA